MRHTWEKKKIPDGAGSVEEACACGTISKRFRSGPRHYKSEHGKFGGLAPVCTLKPLSQQEKRAIARSVIPITEVIPPPPLPDAVNFLATCEAKYQERQALKVASDRRASELSETEAQLKDAYVIINLIYEDLVTAGIRSAGRGMAGRLLYSVGYTEKVKKLENQ